MTYHLLHDIVAVDAQEHPIQVVLDEAGNKAEKEHRKNNATTRWEEFARQRLLMHDLAPERVDNR